MTLSETSKLRIINQQVAEAFFTKAKELVAWMGAVQAQDYSMAKWAIGLRLQNSTDEEIEAAYNRGEILRTHLMRPTWHFVSVDDIYWMLELTSPQIKSLMKSRDKQLELNGDVYLKSNRIIESALSKHIILSREEIGNELEKNKIETNSNRLSHILLRAELDGVVCSGPVKANKLTYCLLADRVPNKKAFARDESLAKLATRYFNSHGPATLSDFVWWSGLSLSEARIALEFVKTRFISETIGSETYWFKSTLTNYAEDDTSIHLLPAFDEFLIGYRDRSASYVFIDNNKTISENGIFRPVLVIEGQVSGLWKRTTKKDKILIEINSFRPFSQTTKNDLEMKAKSYEYFTGKGTKIVITNSIENK